LEKRTLPEARQRLLEVLLLFLFHKQTPDFIHQFLAVERFHDKIVGA
jgi:hypothetical protein